MEEKTKRLVSLSSGNRLNGKCLCYLRQPSSSDPRVFVEPVVEACWPKTWRLNALITLSLGPWSVRAPSNQKSRVRKEARARQAKSRHDEATRSRARKRAGSNPAETQRVAFRAQSANRASFHSSGANRIR